MKCAEKFGKIMEEKCLFGFIITLFYFINIRELADRMVHLYERLVRRGVVFRSGDEIGECTSFHGNFHKYQKNYSLLKY